MEGYLSTSIILIYIYIYIDVGISFWDNYAYQPSIL